MFSMYPAVHVFDIEFPALVAIAKLLCVLCCLCLCLFRLISSVSVLVSVCYIDLLSVLVFLTFILFVFREQKMVQRIHEIGVKYEDLLREVWFLVKIMVEEIKKVVTEYEQRGRSYGFIADTTNHVTILIVCRLEKFSVIFLL